MDYLVQGLLCKHSKLRLDTQDTNKIHTWLLHSVTQEMETIQILLAPMQGTINRTILKSCGQVSLMKMKSHTSSEVKDDFFSLIVATHMKTYIHTYIPKYRNNCNICIQG